MGYWHYDEVAGSGYRLDDRVLLHLKIAIGVKFRRLESFVFTLHASELPAGRGRRVFWMHPSIPLEFAFESPTHPPVNPAWVERLVAAASSEEGLRIIREPR
jgi:hypothetical protein